MTGHRAVAVKGPLDDKHGPPAEVCEECSDLDAGRLVPASFCPELRASGKTAQHDNGIEAFLDAFAGDLEYDRELWRLRAEGKSEEEICQALHGCTIDGLIARTFR